MELYILRHGEAEPRESGIADADRALIKKGRVDVRDVCKAARRAKIEPQLILTSPLRRARETAEVAASVFEGCPMKDTDAMLPDASLDAAWKEACASAKVSHVMLVGHEPHISAFVGYLLGHPIGIEFKKGALIRVDTVKRSGSPDGTLKWMLTPRLVRNL
jgi:phosphohistidine phosphatase